MRCSENCKLCDCVVIELKESYNHILELKLIDHKSMFSFYLSEDNISIIKKKSL